MNVEATATPPVERPPRWRRTRTWLSRLLFAVCIVLVGFWVQSYRYYVSAYNSPFTMHYTVAISWRGQMFFMLLLDESKARPKVAPTYTLLPEDVYESKSKQSPSFRVSSGLFEFRLELGESSILTAPYWLLVLVTGGAASAIKPRPRWNFSLLSLLISVTLLASVLGAFEAAARAYAT